MGVSSGWGGRFTLPPSSGGGPGEDESVEGGFCSSWQVGQQAKVEEHLQPFGVDHIGKTEGNMSGLNNLLPSRAYLGHFGEEKEEKERITPLQMSGAGCQKKSLTLGCTCPGRARLTFAALHIPPPPHPSSARELLRTQAELKRLRALLLDVVSRALPDCEHPARVCPH